MGDVDGRAEMDEGWRKIGRCSSCTFFEVDFGEAPKLYGHCKIHTRTGAREATDWACPEYRPVAGFSELVRLTPGRPAASRARAAARDDSGRAGRRAPTERDAALRRRASEGASRAHGAAARVSGPRPDMRVGVRAAEALGALLGGDSGTGDAMDADTHDAGIPTADVLKNLLVDVVESFIGIDDVALAERWQGGTMTLQPANPESKPTIMPVEAFFHKIVMLRDRLRVLEQKLNGHPGLSNADKVEMQQYISRSYGTLTTFNVLFRDPKDRFSSKG